MRARYDDGGPKEEPYDDTHCCHCGADLPYECEPDTPEFEGYCSPECLDKTRPVIRDERDMIEYLGGKDRNSAERRLYKDTDCGAWIEFSEDGITIGSIVEGSDNGTSSYSLQYPFTVSAYEDRIQAIETEADVIWKWANEENDDTDFPDVSFDYRHLNPNKPF